MRVLALAGALAASLLVGSASAATLVTAVANSPSSLTYYVLDGSEDLRNNRDPFASGGPLWFGPWEAYLFDEGTNVDGEQSLLLHYDRDFGVLSVGNVSGYFVLQLAANEVFLGAADSAASLLATDPSNGVRYQTSFSNLANTTATLLRGVEFPDTYALAYDSGLNQLTVNYSFTNDGAAQDQVRLFFGTTAVPEPATWALLIGGFGMAGATLRRRRLAPARV